MGSNIKVSVTKGTQYSDGQDYTVTVSLKGWYLLLDGTNYSALIDQGNLKNYIGWPSTSVSGYSASTNFGKNFSGPIGYAYAFRTGSGTGWKTYSWSGKVYINRGNSKSANVTKRFGVQSSSTSTGNSSTLTDITFSTTTIAEPSLGNISATVDSKTVKDRKATISFSYTNPESYYSLAYYYKLGSGSWIKISSNVMNITKDMWKKTIYFKAVVTGKDGSSYSKETDGKYIESSTKSIYHKDDNLPSQTYSLFYRDENGTDHEIDSIYNRRNGSNIEING